MKLNNILLGLAFAGLTASAIGSIKENKPLSYISGAVTAVLCLGDIGCQTKKYKLPEGTQ